MATPPLACHATAPASLRLYVVPCVLWVFIHFMVSDVPWFLWNLLNQAALRSLPSPLYTPLPVTNANAKRSIKMIPAMGFAPFRLRAGVLDSLRNLFKFVSRTYAGSVRVCTSVCVSVWESVFGFCYHIGLGIMKCFNAFRPHKHSLSLSNPIGISLSLTLVSQNSYQKTCTMKKPLSKM